MTKYYKYLTPKLLRLVFLLWMPFMLAQNDFRSSNSKFTYGFGVKLNVEFLHRWEPDFKLSVSGGIGYNATIDTYGITPTLHAGFLFFNDRVIGADQSRKWYEIQTHAFACTTATFQLDALDFNPLIRPVPLYYFSEFTANPLQNPYKSSASYGLNLVFVENFEMQRTGFFNLNVLGRFQLSYYNDGGPVLGWAGDNRDRYYTGGLVLSYHGYIYDFVNLIELSYHKYTGYQEYAFDVGEHLQIDFINYGDRNQFKYNQQRWRLNISNLDTGYGASLSLYNFNSLDVQDYLHFTTNVPYHPDYKRRWRMTAGARYEFNNSKF